MLFTHFVTLHLNGQERFRNSLGKFCSTQRISINSWEICWQDKPTLHRGKSHIWEKQASKRAKTQDCSGDYGRTLDPQILALFNKRELEKLNVEHQRLQESRWH